MNNNQTNNTHNPQENIDCIAEMEHTQLGPGDPDLKGITIATKGLTFGRLKLEPLFSGHTVLKPEYAMAWIPLSWKGNYKFNGMNVTQNTVGLVTGEEGYFTRGEHADVVGIAISKEELHHEMSILSGLTPDELILPDGGLTMSNNNIIELRKTVSLSYIPNNESETDCLMKAIREELFESLLTTQFHSKCSSRDQKNELIVYKAEEYFMSIFPKQPSLIELCTAAGVGKNRLYVAFHKLFDLSPSAYFRKRRLSSAHSALVHSQYKRGAVKRIALNHNFKEFGRFAQEYKSVFGQNPSDTIK